MGSKVKKYPNQEITYVDDELHDFIGYTADSLERSRSWVIRRLLERAKLAELDADL